MRVKMTLSYDGSHFYGFQVQNSGVTTVANRLYAIFRSLGIDGAFEASGRTDRGVHATGQVVGIDIPPFWQKDLMKLREHINRKALPHIFIHKIEEVADDFHARYDAKKRIYRYLFSPKTPSVFFRNYVSCRPVYDLKRLSEVLKLFEGTHDFGYFKKTGSHTENDIRTLYKTRLYSRADYAVIYFEANGFLRSQVRMMLSAAFETGEENLDPQCIIDQLQQREKHFTTPVSPNGLYLSRVIY